MTFSAAAASLATSTTNAQQLALSNILSIARGGAISVASSAASSALLHVASQNDNSPAIQELRGGSTPWSNISPRGSSVLCMAIAMSLHYLSYSIARNTAAFPLAMAFISPTSLMLLVLYGKILNKAGPKGAVRQTTFLCASVLWGMEPIHIPFFGGSSMKLLQLLVGALFIFRESYVQLLTSQYWSFMASILTPDQSAKWFSPISGLTSVTSAVAGLGVSNVVEAVGLSGALGLAGLILTTSLIFTEKAYAISDKGGFTPSDDEMKKTKKGKKAMTPKSEDLSLFRKASGLFVRVPVLKALFIEILAGQGLATLLNVCFVTKLSQSLPDDTMRAGWMGKFFASINGVAMCLQFGVIPKIMPYLEPRTLWRFMPTVMVMEFSIRRMLDEMVYVPLDFESRFLGKEIISVFGYRFGKSGMSLALSGGAAFLWLTAAWNVSNRVLSRAEAETLYQSKKKGGKKNSRTPMK
eukprot:scaffold10209_cov233-Chaetoceros_neogracile.AAC.6